MRVLSKIAKTRIQKEYEKGNLRHLPLETKLRLSDKGLIHSVKGSKKTKGAGPHGHKEYLRQKRHQRRHYSGGAEKGTVEGAKYLHNREKKYFKIHKNKGYDLYEPYKPYVAGPKTSLPKDPKPKKKESKKPKGGGGPPNKQKAPKPKGGGGPPNKEKVEKKLREFDKRWDEKVKKVKSKHPEPKKKEKFKKKKGLSRRTKAGLAAAGVLGAGALGYHAYKKHKKKKENEGTS